VAAWNLDRWVEKHPHVRGKMGKAKQTTQNPFLEKREVPWGLEGRGSGGSIFAAGKKGRRVKEKVVNRGGGGKAHRLTCSWRGGKKKRGGGSKWAVIAGSRLGRKASRA